MNYTCKNNIIILAKIDKLSRCAALQSHLKQAVYKAKYNP